MNSENSNVNQSVKIKIEDEPSYSSQELPWTDSRGNSYIAVKMEEDKPSEPTEPPMLAGDYAIKTEEVFYITELPDEEVDVPMYPASGETSNIFRCYLCEESNFFQDKNALQVHLFTSHPKQKKYNCDKCSEHRANIVAINQHLQRHDPSLRPYKCEVCSLRFTNVNNQKQHEADIHQLINGRSKRNQRKRRVCPVCRKQVIAEIYDLHLQSEHSDAKLVCPVCQEEFYTKNKLSEHELFVHGSSSDKKKKSKSEEDVFKCYICKSEVLLDNHELLHQHLVTVHEKQFKYRCDECNYSTREITRFNNHLSRHDPIKKPFKCNICLIRFIKARSLKYHEVIAHNIGGTKEHYDCTVCNKQLASCRELSLHMRIHKSKQKATQSEIMIEEDQNEEEENNPSSIDTIPPPKCYLCNIVLDDDATLKEHMNKNHKISSEESRFKCTECDFTHLRPLAFNIHLQKHDPTANPYKCTYCTLHFTTIRYKKFHEITKHGHTTTPQPSTINMEAVLRCYLCSTHTLMESKNALNRHLRAAHPKQSIYSCAQCEFTTGMKLAFNNHHAKHDPAGNYVEIHTKMYRCSVCPKEFPTRSRLILHQRRVGHAAPESFNLKTITSEESSTGTGSLDESTSGQRSTPQKTYKCLETYPCLKCDKKFVNKWSRTRHERQVHEAKTFANDKKSKVCNELKCYLCRTHTTLPNKRSLEQHLQTIHNSCSMYHCRKCTYSTTKQDQFNDHLAWHDPVKRKFKCNSCSQRFLTARTKRCHEIFAHRKESANVTKLEQTEESENENQTEFIQEGASAQEHSSKFQMVARNKRNSFKCYQCEPAQHLETRRALLRHLTIAHPHLGSYECRECSASFRSKTTFNQHLSRHDTSERPFKCCVCSLRFTSRTFKKRHEILLHGISNGCKNGRNVCASCGMKFPSNKELKKHEVDAHTPQREKYGCSICGKTFSFQSVLQMHQVSHFNAPVKDGSLSEELESEIKIEAVEINFESTVKDTDSVTSAANCIIRCHICDNAVKMEDEKALHEHLLKDHPRQKVYHCNECNASFDEIITFNQHLQQHDASIYPHKCDVCPLRFNEEQTKNQHEADMHQLNNGMPSNSEADTGAHVGHSDITDESAEPLLAEYELQIGSDDKQPQKLVPKCYLCSTPKEFVTKNALVLHMKTDHPYKSEYNCAECDFTSTSSQSFNSHQAKHDPDKPHKCSICTVRFFTVKTKKYHEASEHDLKTGVKVYSCPVCGKKCASNADVERHRIDSRYCGSKPSAGDASNNSEDSSALGEPLQKKHHAAKILTCYLCSTPQEFDTKHALAQHLKSHRNQFSYSCNECDYTTIIKREFNNHQRKHDTSKLPYKCSVCQQRFVTDRTRKFHEASQHRLDTGVAVHRCPVCDKMFKYKCRLQEHLIDSTPCARKISAKDDSQEQLSSEELSRR